MSNQIYLHLKAHLHQASGSTLRQLYYDASDSVLIETMELFEYGLFSIRTELLVSLQSRRRFDAQVWCKWTLTL